MLPPDNQSALVENNTVHHQQFGDYHSIERLFFTLLSYNQIDLEDMALFATGVQASGLNPVLVHRIDHSFSSNITACRQFFKQKKLPWALILPEYFFNNEVQLILRHHHMDLKDEGVAMTISVNDRPIHPHESPLIIKEINNDLPTWSIPLIYGFESTPEITGIYTSRHQLATNTGTVLHHFSGFLGDQAVSSLTLSISDGIARLDDVATMPEYQKRGYASDLIHTALNYLKQLNIETCFLEASTSGLSIYKRLGFKPLFKNFYFEASD